MRTTRHRVLPALLLAAAGLFFAAARADGPVAVCRDFSATNDPRRLAAQVDAAWAEGHRVGGTFDFQAAVAGQGPATNVFRLAATPSRVGHLSWHAAGAAAEEMDKDLPGSFNAHGYCGTQLDDGRVLLVYRCVARTDTNRCWLVGWAGPAEALFRADLAAAGVAFRLQPPADPEASPRTTGRGDALEVRRLKDGAVEITFLGDDAPAAARWRLAPEDLAREVTWWTRWRPKFVWFGGLLLALLDGLLVSCEIFFLTLHCALPLGLLVAAGRMSPVRPVSLLARGYISVMRGTPLMLQIIFVYYGPNYLFGWSLSGYPMLLATVIAFSMNYAAYFAEIYRSGIQSIEMGQWEAAKALGLGRGRTFFRIVFPQVVKRVLPAITNEVITLVKDTSLAFTIAFMEMFTVAKQIAAESTTILPLVVAGVFYYFFNYLVAWGMERIEKRFAYYR